VLLPQLISKCTVQYRVERSIRRRFLNNALRNGRVIRGEGIRPLSRRWRLSYRGLTREECSAIESFYATVNSSGSEFVFLEPASNLISYSESAADPPWQHDPQLSVTNEEEVTADGTRIHRVTNSGMNSQSLWQDIEITGLGTFCASCCLRSSIVSICALSMKTSSQTASKEVEARDEWKQGYLGAELESEPGPVRVELAIPPGASIQVSAFQLENQPFPSTYKPTAAAGGVHSSAKTVDGSYVVAQIGPDWFDCELTVEA